jgi:hypothetical protein
VTQRQDIESKAQVHEPYPARNGWPISGLATKDLAGCSIGMGTIPLKTLWIETLSLGGAPACAGFAGTRTPHSQFRQMTLN